MIRRLVIINGHLFWKKKKMAKILPDREIKKLLGTVVIDGEENNLNPNGIELRLGKHVRFDSTGEQKNLKLGNFLKVTPGETVLISSLEKLDFTTETVNKEYPNKMLMAIITPTTTMMREGISQVSTKVDAGFRGHLNWSFRNSSTKDFLIQYGEPIFKITLFLLEEDETPEVAYGDEDKHRYQDTDGIKLSSRRIPAQITKDSIISSSVKKIDPKKQLAEAGYPFNHIGTELIQLHGKFEVVSKDVVLLKDQFENLENSLSKKIHDETSAIYNHLNDLKSSILDKVESVFQVKFIWLLGILIGAASMMCAAYKYIQSRGVCSDTIAAIAFVVGLVIIVATAVIVRKSK